jgi:hypothetical protein
MSISKRTSRRPLSSLRMALCGATCLILFGATGFAATLTGTVTDRTTGKPSSGDTIAVINTNQGMDEITKTTSDSSGKFHVAAPDGGQILLHVTHAGAEYFKSVPPGSSSVDVDIYDSATKIEGITGEALVLRAETDSAGKTLNVAENFFVQNSSAPPRTEYGGNTFDFYLPKGAQISESLASSPGGLPTNTAVKTIDAATGHYAFTFPVRPGETRFQVAYTLPYSDKLIFGIKLSVPTGDVAVMLPKSMQFQSPIQFQAITDPSVVSSQSYDVHEPPFAQPVQFTIAGNGQLPQDQPQGTPQAGADQSGNAGPSAQTANGSRPGGGLGAPIDPEGTNDPWSKYKWWILGALGLTLAAGAGLMLKNSPATAVPGPPPPGYVEAPAPAPAYPEIYTPSAVSAPVPVPTPAANPILQVLKDELFVLETDRLAGKLTASEYVQHKAAFDVVLRRALGRIEPAPAASNE